VGNALSHKLGVGERRSLASHYTLTTDQCSNSKESLQALIPAQPRHPQVTGVLKLCLRCYEFFSNFSNFTFNFLSRQVRTVKISSNDFAARNSPSRLSGIWGRFNSDFSDSTARNMFSFAPQISSTV